MNSVAVLLEIIRRAIAIVFLAGSTVELRIPKTRRGTVSGYFNDPEQLAQAVLNSDGIGPGVYWTLNPVDPNLLARRANRMEPFAKDTTTDAQILCRQWILIDCDPKRHSGISATDDEHEAALERARHIRKRLSQESWPDPVFVDSGNGAHLLYRCELPNDAQTAELLRRVLLALAARHDDDAVEVDKTTFNAARICKVPGTTARKGDSMPDRPHRLAQLLDAPATLVPVPRDLLERLAGEAPEQSKRTPSRGGAREGAGSPRGGASCNSEKWLIEHGVEIMRGPVAHDGGWRIIIRCPFNAEHDNAAVFEGADGKRGFNCFHNSCAEYDWHAFRSKVDPDYEANGAPNPTDVGNAKRFVARHGESLRYCHAWGKWLVWEGTRWRIDETGRIERLAKETVKAIYGEALQLSDTEKAKLIKHALKSEHEQRIKAMIALARSEPGIPVSPSQLDRHPFLLNVLNGTLDLRSGELQKPRREDLLTKLAPVEYDPAAKAPEFMRFMIQIMRGKRNLIRYVQRVLGYALTGSTVEQVFFLFLGGGSNGKSTLLTLLHDLLGADYAMDTPAETFAAKLFGDGISNDLARLKGARFVTAVELEARKLDESKLKRITGQDPITARFMRAEFFQFMAEFKLFIACNHKPVIESDGHAMWRRIRLVPFDATFHNPDRTLPARLRRELSGILAWCVRGCLAWQKCGLGVAESVSAATASYRQEMDSVGRFLADCCETKPDTKTAAKDFFAAYGAWCGRAGESPMTQARFGRKLTERGVMKARGGAGGTYAYTGIALIGSALKGLNVLNDHCNNSLETTPIAANTEKVQTEPFSFSDDDHTPTTPPTTPTTPPTPTRATRRSVEKEWLV